MTWTETHIILKVLARDTLICIGLGLAFAFLGVYDTDGLALLPRIFFWTVIMCFGAVLFSLVEPLVFGRLLKAAHPAAQILVVAIIISLPITVFLVGLNTQFSFDWPARHWVGQFGSVIIISLIATLARFFVFQFASRIRDQEQDDEETLDPRGAFLERLPVKYRSADLYAVSSEGHYLRVHTDRGSHLILMRISDAIRELKNADGLQIHRSWWAARAGIADVKREKGRHMLVLKNDEVAPVSRSFLPAVKSANLDT